MHMDRMDDLHAQVPSRPGTAWLTLDEAARRLNISTRQLRRLNDLYPPRRGRGESARYQWPELSYWWLEYQHATEARKRLPIAFDWWRLSKLGTRSYWELMHLLESLPTQLAPRILGLSSETAISIAIEREIHHRLADIGKSIAADEDEEEAEAHAMV
jgi:hypothetical protein